MVLSQRIALLVVVVIYNFNSVESSSEEDDCDACTIQFETTIGLMKGTFKKRDPIKLDTPSPCDECHFGGISSIAPNGDVCSEKVKENGKDCFDHRLKLKFQDVFLECNCTLPLNPAEVAQMMAEKAKNPMQGMDCMGSGKTPVDGIKMTQGGFDTMATNPATLMSMTECKPKMPDVKSGMSAMGGMAGMGGSKSMAAKPQQSQTVTGGIIMKYKIFEMEVVLRKCEEEPVKTTEVKLIRPDPSLMTVECVASGDKAFKEPCECFAKTDYMDKQCDNGLNSMFPCYGDEKVNEHRDIMEQLSCNS